MYTDNQPRARAQVRFNPANSEHSFKALTEKSRKGKWNVFEYTDDKENDGSSPEQTKRIKKYMRILKIFLSILIFLVILGSSVTSKIALIFMTTHVTPNREVPFCDINRPDLSFGAIIPDHQRIAWIWAIIITFTIPELGTLFRSWRLCFFKKIQRATFAEFFIVFVAETFHAIGLAMLMIFILPNLNVVQGIMLTNCLCFIPAVLNIFADVEEKSTENEEPRLFDTKINFILNILAAVIQLIGFGIWPWLTGDYKIWLTPVALVLISFHWWENFVSAKSRFKPIVALNHLKISLSRSRYSTYLYMSIWKIVAFAISAMLFADIGFTPFFSDFIAGWEIHKIDVTETLLQNTNYQQFPELPRTNFSADEQTVYSSTAAIYITICIQVAASYICYVFTKFACKIKIQTFGFGMSINLTIPVAIAILSTLVTIRNADVCAFHDILPDYLFFDSPPEGSNNEIFKDWYSYIPLLWTFSQAWITRHIWSPRSNKNASTDSLFVTPLYNGLVIDQSLALNRRRHSLSDIQQTNSVLDEENTVTLIQPEDTIPKLFVCGTMWHEEKDEIISFLKSILRLDEDYSARFLAKEYLKVETTETEFYELESHIFFDDAFGHDPKEGVSEHSEEMNKYVRTLITSISEASMSVYNTKLKYENPIRYPTPYGGRLEWSLPGGSKLIAHLKNSRKIRAKKRWSQVMYMYYLLGHRLMQKSDLDDNRKTVASENTFILALDGDIDFQPEAVHLLLNRMKVDETLGAACGRIHPIGDGPMVWYQKFEYAIGHWLQKATEHVIGCVLCSPGCFSLFRGSALMDGGILKRYTTVSEDASNFVQYDQGEDRWLCTLLLKEKYRVEYSAAADAYTHCPEGFNEFYNQRRRWVPSTMANILDLLKDAKQIVRKNDSISMLYIIYQMAILVGTILGPGTIFLMMVGALVNVFSIDIWTSFQFNFIPIVIFMVICYKFKRFQLPVALFLTGVYSLVMMAVLIGVVIQFIEDGTASPSSLFFIVVAAEIIIAGIVHPQEIGCLICGLIYYITIPSMYMLLIIYSLFNMNDVSWGTRETPKPDATEKEGTSNSTEIKQEETGAIDCSLFSLCRCMICIVPKPPENNDKLQDILKELKEIQTQIGNPNSVTKPNSPPLAEIKKQPVLYEKVTPVQQGQDPDWLTNTLIRYGQYGRLDSDEREFWKELIAEYLKPLQYTGEELKKYRKQVQDKLNNLRDKCVATFLMLNALFVIIVYLFQINREYLHIIWPYGANNYIVFDETTQEILITPDYMRVEPIGLLFVLFFGIILFIQFFAMLIHRFGTLSQILAEVNVEWGINRMPLKKSIDGTAAVKHVKKLQRPKALGDIDETSITETLVGRRRDTVKKILEIQKNLKIEQSTLRGIFFENPATANLFKKMDLELPSVADDQHNIKTEQDFEPRNTLDRGSESYRPQSFDRPISSDGQVQTTASEEQTLIDNNNSAVDKQSRGRVNFAYEPNSEEIVNDGMTQGSIV